MKALLLDSNHDVLHETLEAAGIICTKAWNWTTQDLLKALPEFEIIVLRSRLTFNENLLNTCKSLKIIARVGAGMEAIDTRFANSKGIYCLSVPEGNRDAVAEHALGMLLMLLNKLHTAHSEVCQGIWKRAENRGTELNSLSVGIVGFGNTGQRFSALLKGFGCKQYIVDPYQKPSPNSGLQTLSISDLTQVADVVSLHIPYNSETHYIINDAFIHRMKKPFYLINTSRGACADTGALVRGLKSGKIRGLCLDVIEYEAVDFNSNQSIHSEQYDFLKRDARVVMSPHIAGWTHESNYKMSRGIALKIIEALKNPA